MNVMVVGLGSMGKRRINLLAKYFPDIQICGVDINQGRRDETEERFKLNLYEDIGSAIMKEKPDAVMVCSPPESHGPIILECIKARLHIFSEINLVPDRYEEIMEEAKKNNVMLFLSSTMLYRKEIEIIRDLIAKQKSKVNYRYHVGQYLFDWHPWDRENGFFAWNKRTNGCREIFAIELPWIIKTFGKVKDVFVLKDNISTLRVEYPDNYIIVLEHESGNKGVFLADIISRKAVRELFVYSENLHILWSGTPNSLCQYHIDKKSMEAIDTYSEIESDPEYADSIIENAYLDELKVFFDKIAEKQNQEKYTFDDDQYTLQLIDRIEGTSEAAEVNRNDRVR